MKDFAVQPYKTAVCLSHRGKVLFIFSEKTNELHEFNHQNLVLSLYFSRLISYLIDKISNNCFSPLIGCWIIWMKMLLCFGDLDCALLRQFAH